MVRGRFVAVALLAIPLLLALLAVPAAAAVCGDGICEESCDTCPTDCGPCQSNTVVTSCVNPHQFAFTFDDGPSWLTPGFLDTLKQLDIKIGFFVIGQNVRSLPQHTKRAHDEGHYICSHTDSHPSLPNLPEWAIRQEMLDAEQAIFEATGCVRTRCMRPPYGDIDWASQQVLWDMGYLPIKWTVDTNDWQGWDSLAQVEAALAWASPSSIIVLQHDTYQHSIDDVPAIAEAVRSYGYEIVRLDECIYGTTMTSSRVWQTSLCSSAVCGDGQCDENAENCDSCSLDCGACPPTCGDSVCDPTETCSGCAADCGNCPLTCGDFVCQATESCTNCPTDCGACPAACGDQVCQASESCRTCPSDCGICGLTCGDNVCQASESCSTCASDCGPCAAGCGDGVCQTSESCATCAADCCAGGNSVFTGPLTLDGTCGSNNANNAICAAGQCCSKHGWCGVSTAHCAGSSVSTGVPVICGDAKCNSAAGESCANCPKDCVCANPCGDGTCAVTESCTSCPADCGTCPVDPPTAVCGDALCNGIETCTSCAKDCGPCQPVGVASTCVNAKDYALTFDAGPTASTPALLDVLKAKKARATFFVSGMLAGATGMTPVLQRMANEGHLIGARSFDNLDFTTLTDDAIREKLALSDKVVQAATCQRPRLLRPPLGRFTDAQRTFLESLGYKLVGWNLDTLDFSSSTSTDIVNTVSSALAARPASVIHLQHDKDAVSVNSISAIIDLVTAAGYNLVTLDQCVYGHVPSAYRDYQVSRCSAYCGDFACSASESCSACAMDCGTCADRCGDGVCSAAESCSTCCADCGACVTRPVSTDARCGANSATNAVCPTGQCCSQYGWCGTGTAYCTGSSDTGASNCTPTTAVCGDKVCSSTETCSSCPGDCGVCGAVCGDTVCNGQETCTSCPGDCGTCSTACGNARCEAGETCASCASDCGSCPAVCGNSNCEAGETCVTCAADCGVCPATCGDNVCAATETCGTCPADCGACPATCGDRSCAATESCVTCPGDCGVCPPTCGDGRCVTGETCTSCPGDCGACPPVCGDRTCSTGETCATCPGDCGPCTATGTCSGCWGLSTGPCKSVIGVCYPFGADGRCVPGTTACTLAATVGLASAADVSVVTLEVASRSANITSNDFTSQARATLVQSVASAAAVDADRVQLLAIVDQGPALRTGSIDRTAPATNLITSAVVVQLTVSSSSLNSIALRNAVLSSDAARDLSVAMSVQTELGPVSQSSAEAAGAHARSVSGAVTAADGRAIQAGTVSVYVLMGVAGVLVLAAVAAIVYVRKTRATIVTAVSPQSAQGGPVFSPRVRGNPQ